MLDGQQTMRLVTNVIIQRLPLGSERIRRFTSAGKRYLRRTGHHLLSLSNRVTMTEQDFANREGFRNFNFRLYRSREHDGVSAMLRVKNEASKIAYVLASIYDLFDEIVLVDNGSTDGTVDIAGAFKMQKDRSADKVRIYAYPFDVARCGAEHAATPEDSVHSLVYFYNWALSRCSCRYVCKWDGDMIVRKDAKEPLRNWLNHAQSQNRKWCGLSGQTVYRDPEMNFYLSDEINWEIRIFPYGYNPRFRKVNLYEALVAEPQLPAEDFPGIAFYELKFADENEFSHLTGGEFPTARKQLEMKNFAAIQKGEAKILGFRPLPRTFLQHESGLNSNVSSSATLNLNLEPAATAH